MSQIDTNFTKSSFFTFDTFFCVKSEKGEKIEKCERDVRHSYRLLEERDSDFCFYQNTVKLPHGTILVKVSGMKSRFKAGVGRTVFVLFKDGGIEDTLCSCESGKRTIGGCAHGVAFLRLIMKQQKGSDGKFFSLKSDSAFDSLTIPDFEDVESDSDSESDSADEK